VQVVTVACWQFGMEHYSRELSRFLLDACQAHRLTSLSIFRKFDGHRYPAVHPVHDSLTSAIPLVTGSAAEFQIVPPLPCFGDVDVMFHYTGEVAMAEGRRPYARLPATFDAEVQLYEIRDSQYPGYVFLVPSYFLRRRGRGGSYDSKKCSSQRCPLNNGPYVDGISAHGPASLRTLCLSMQRATGMETLYHADSVKCVRCLEWPRQAADWPTRHREYGWPDSATIDYVVGNGCDAVPVAHRQCRHSEWMSRHQWRLSFSRAEVVLLNNWTPVQQIVYHMLRVFVKTERLAVDNYRIKTLMLWACEQKPPSFWTAQPNLFAICVHLLHRFGVWLADARCQHYFVSKCNLFGHSANCFELQEAAVICSSITEDSLVRWFVDNYLRKCASLCPDNAVMLFENLQTKEQLRDVIAAVEKWKQYLALLEVARICNTLVLLVLAFRDDVSAQSMRQRSFVVFDIMLNWLKSATEIVSGDKKMGSAWKCMLFTFVNSWHHIPWYGRILAEIITLGLPVFLSSISSRNTNCHEINFIELCKDIILQQKNSLLWKSKAAALLKVLSAKPHGPEALELITVAKIYLHKAVNGDHSDSDSIYSLTNVYLAVLHYITGHYQMAIDHCILGTWPQNHSTNGSSHVVNGELLPKIDDNIDNALGLAVLYQYLRTAELNRLKERSQSVSIFTTELFAHYFTIKCLLPAKCLVASPSQATSTAMSVKSCLREELVSYRRNLLESKQLSTADLMLLKLPRNSYFVAGFPGRGADVGVFLSTPPRLSQLIELLRQNSIERLMTSRHKHVPEQNVIGPSLSYFEPLIAYRCCLYEQCVHLCHEIVSATIDSVDDCLAPLSATYSEFIQLVDTDLVSLMGLANLVRPDLTKTLRTITVGQLALSLYLMTQCHIIRHDPLTSLIQTADLVDASFETVSSRRMFDGLVLQLSRKLLVRKIISYDEDNGPPVRRTTRRTTPRGRFPQRSDVSQTSDQTDMTSFMRFGLHAFNKFWNKEL